MSAPRQLGQDIYQGREREGAGDAHHGETVLVGKPPPGVDSVLRWILRPARIVTGTSTAMNRTIQAAAARNLGELAGLPHLPKREEPRC